MDVIKFSAESVIESNKKILETEPGFKGGYDIRKLEGALVGELITHTPVQ